jgi:hypothetical protein
MRPEVLITERFAPAGEPAAVSTGGALGRSGDSGLHGKRIRS